MAFSAGTIERKAHDPPTTLLFPGGLGGANWVERRGIRTPVTSSSRLKTSAYSGPSRRRGQIHLSCMTKPHRAKTTRRSHGRPELTLSEAPVGPPDSDQFVDWRHRLAGAARHYRTAFRGKTEHRTSIG